MKRRRRARTRRRYLTLGAAVVAVAALYVFGIWPFQNRSPSTEPIAQHSSPESESRDTELVRLTAPIESDPPADQRTSPPAPSNEFSPPSATVAAEPGSAELAVIRRRVETGLNARSAGDLVTARDMLKTAVGAGLPEAEESVVRSALLDIAARSLFSPERLPDDPLTGVHVIQSGEVMDRIARNYAVTADLLAAINGITNKNRIRLGQRIKVIHGPLHAVINKNRYSCQLFLQDVLVAEFPVGLGEYDSTPVGEWVVKDKLINPTYYPPASRGGPIIAADDPKNPLGEYWIGLKGVAGDAVGQFGYGIHGTIDPDSIGKSVSLGCVRLRDEDITRLYSMLTVNQSRVVIE